MKIIFENSVEEVDQFISGVVFDVRNEDVYIQIANKEIRVEREEFIRAMKAV